MKRTAEENDKRQKAEESRCAPQKCDTKKAGDEFGMKLTVTRRPTQIRLIIAEKRSPLREGLHDQSSSSKGHSPKRAGMSKSKIIAEFESGDFDLDDSTSMGSTPFCHVCMN